jgi:hypothetical protein
MLRRTPRNAPSDHVGVTRRTASEPTVGSSRNTQRAIDPDLHRGRCVNVQARGLALRLPSTPIQARYRAPFSPRRVRGSCVLGRGAHGNGPRRRALCAGPDALGHRWPALFSQNGLCLGNARLSHGTLAGAQFAAVVRVSPPVPRGPVFAESAGVRVRLERPRSGSEFELPDSRAHRSRIRAGRGRWHWPGGARQAPSRALPEGGGNGGYRP